MRESTDGLPVLLDVEHELRRIAQRVSTLIDEETARRSEHGQPQAPALNMGARIGEALQTLANGKREAERDRDEARATVSDLQRQLAEADQENQSLRDENKDLHIQIKALATSHMPVPAAPASKPKGTGPKMGTVADAVDAARKLSRLRFLPSAVRSAAESPFEQPEKVYEGLCMLSQLAGQRLSGSIGMSVEDWLAQAGIEYASRLGPEKDMAKHREKYMFDVDGTPTLMEKHLKFGNSKEPRHCLRVYMEWCEGQSVWVVGHVGRHLDNAKT